MLQFIPEEKNCLVGGLQSADFFRGDNKEVIDARNEVCMLRPSSVFICSRIGCQIGCQLHQTIKSKSYKRVLETYQENHQSYLAPFCVCVCIFSPSLMQEAGFSAHNVQVAVLAMEDMLVWMKEGGQVGALFFNLF